MQEGGNAFGSGFVAEGTVVLFSNRAGRGFSLAPGHPTIISPGKRTMPTQNCYTPLKDGQPAIIGGTPGLGFQAQCGLQIVTDPLDFGIAPREAVEAPRWWTFSGTDPDAFDTPMDLRTEAEMPEGTLEGLERLGRKVARRRPEIHDGKTQLIVRISDPGF